MASNHTPTPWVVDRDNRPGMDWNNHITGANYRTICAMFHDGTEDNLTGEANAALIVAAVNAYEANTARLSELEAENRRMRWALDYFKRIADERERTPAGELVVVSIESCRDARAALEAQS